MHKPTSMTAAERKAQDARLAAMREEFAKTAAELDAAEAEVNAKVASALGVSQLTGKRAGRKTTYRIQTENGRWVTVTVEA